MLRLPLGHRSLPIPMHPCRHALLKRSTSARCFASESGPPTMPATAVRRGISDPAGWNGHSPVIRRQGICSTRFDSVVLTTREQPVRSSCPEGPSPNTSTGGLAAIAPQRPHQETRTGTNVGADTVQPRQPHVRDSNAVAGIHRCQPLEAHVR